MESQHNSDESFCRDIVAALQGWQWKWDGRFGAVLAEFPADDQAKVRAILGRHFGSVWERSNIDTAPDAVQSVKAHFGGLMTGQLLFTSAPGQEGLIYCAWWPWGNGKTISLRLAPFHAAADEAKKIERIDLFKACFGI